MKGVAYRYSLGYSVDVSAFVYRLKKNSQGSSRIRSKPEAMILLRFNSNLTSYTSLWQPLDGASLLA